MNKLIKKQSLTLEQYHRANLVMCLILSVSYLVYLIVEVININKFGMSTGLLARCIIYAIMLVLSIVTFKLFSSQKKCMIIFAVTFLFAYSLLVFGNGVVVMVMVFPVLIGFMIYLNSLLVGIGCISALLICATKCLLVMNSGNTELFNYGILIFAGLIVSIFGAYITILLLIDFSKEDRAVIEKEAAHRTQVAITVAEIVEKLDLDFKEVLSLLQEVDVSMNTADKAMKDMAGSSENAADAINNQAGMTTHIQERLKNATELSQNASATAEQLKTIVADGKNISDKLQQHSIIVDQNIAKISKTIDQLVENVNRVSGFTQAIENISSQTNMLALNASIEAARAGEAGRGFAVVADQIGKLAADSAQSAVETKELIHKSLVEVETGNNIVEHTMESFNSVLANMENFAGMASGAAEASKEQAEMLRQIEIGIEQITEVVENNSAAAEETSAVSEELSAQATNLEQMISHFVLLEE